MRYRPQRPGQDDDDGDDELWTVDRVAGHWHVSIRTVRRRIAEGTLHAVRLGPRLLRIRRDEVERIDHDGQAPERERDPDADPA